MSLKIEISDKCTGHGRCYMLAERLFEPDAEGYGALLQGTVDSPEGIEAARTAAEACPEVAVLLTEL
ncbi:ferredoxin [Streptomyces sp. NPDC059766]|uniref:ferredoxin n=1 Tax=Streptomyces sp. NPDC059766 TaxID=3346940 RepID=UPI0036500E21